MTAVKYKFVKSSRIPVTDHSDAAAQVIGTSLAEIAEKHGSLKPILVVNEARAESSPLHRFFEWDDRIAGDKWRTRQAASLIKHIRVVSNASHAEPALERPFISIKQSRGTSTETFYAVASVLSPSQLRIQAIAAALSYLALAKGELKEFRELVKPRTALEKAEHELSEARTRLRDLELAKEARSLSGAPRSARPSTEAVP